MSIFSKNATDNLNPLYDGIIQLLGVSSAEQTYQAAISVIFWVSVLVCCIMLLIALKAFREEREHQVKGDLSNDSLLDADSLDTNEIKRNKKDAGSIFGMLSIIGGIVALSLAFKMSDHIMAYIQKDTLPAYNLDLKTDSKSIYAENEVYYSNILQSDYAILSDADKQAFKEMLFGDVSKECSDRNTHCNIILNNQLLTKALENTEGINLAQFLDKYKSDLLAIKLNEEEKNRLKQETEVFLALEKKLAETEKELFKNTVGDSGKSKDEETKFFIQRLEFGQEVEINDEMARKIKALSLKDKEDLGIEGSSQSVFDESKPVLKPMANPDVRSAEWVQMKNSEIQNDREKEERPELCKKLINLGIMDLVREYKCEEYLNLK